VLVRVDAGAIRMRRLSLDCFHRVIRCGLLVAAISPFLSAPGAAQDGPDHAVEVEVNKKGLGKEAVLRMGPHEWYILVEVTPDNTVIVRQEKNLDSYVLDDSETHDRSFTPAEVDAVIEEFVSSAKVQAAKYQ
jgi:hypothetical protein